MPFAEGTAVPVARSRAEIEVLVQKHGATTFASAMKADAAQINFVCHGRLLRFDLPLPTKTGVVEHLKKTRQMYRWRAVPDGVAEKELAAEQRRRWRCLLLAIKAKLEVVETGIETFEQAFLANIVTDENITIYERLKVEGSGVKMLAPAGGT